MTEKYCKKCDQWKLFSEFHKQKDNKDGYRSTCKACTSASQKAAYPARRESIVKYQQENREEILEYKRRRYQENRDAILDYAKNYHQENREQILEKNHERYLKNWDHHAEYRRVYREQNRDYYINYYYENWDHYADWRREYYQENREQILERSRAYKKAHPEKRKADKARRKAREISTTTTDSWELNEIEIFYNDCPEGYQVDHIVPLALGGRHELSNLQHLETWLNQSKNAKHPDDWDDSRPISCRA